ncbi:MAG: hypothetical protein M1838_005663 [Thelocarpon superellum]|nr:MAG: hypothetical protein M1838_005663 [Thelocarpon superellum]
MSLFPRHASPPGDFAPLFRLLDDYDVHRGGASKSIRAFQPKFDVREIKDAYELHGELPGISQNDVSIEFTDTHTLVIKGRTERESHFGNPTAGSVTDVSEQSADSHKATVEDEESTAVSTSNASDKQVKKPETTADKPKYWVTERSVGEFHRSFSFPSRVDQDAVKASMKNGILSIVVPKSTAPQSKKITIS